MTAQRAGPAAGPPPPPSSNATPTTRGTEGDVSEETIVDRVAVRVRELESQLNTFSERLRSMRRRNRQLEDEIAAFEQEIDQLRDWLSKQTGDAS